MRPGSLFVPSVRGQQQSQPYQHTFAVPGDAACFVDVVNTAQDPKIPNTLTFTAYLPAGDQLTGRSATDLAGGKAASVFIP